MLALPSQSAADALLILGDLFDRKAMLRMSYLYRGMLLTQNLVMVAFNEGQLLVRAERNWLVVTPDDGVYLHSPAIEDVLGARVLEINISANQLVLSNFICTGRPWVDRGYERVQPAHPIRVMLRVGEHALSTSLENISMIGVGLLAYKLVDHGIELYPGQPVKLDFDLSSGLHMGLPGRVVNLLSPGGHVTCLGINTYPNMDQSRILERYIAQRKEEILSELDHVFIEVFEPQSVKQLYF